MSTIPHQGQVPGFALSCVALRRDFTLRPAWPATLVPRYLPTGRYIQLAACSSPAHCCRFRTPQGPSPLLRSQEPRVCRRQKLSRSLFGSRSRGCTPTIRPPERDHHHSPRRQRERKTTTRSRLLLRLSFYYTYFLVHSIPFSGLVFSQLHPSLAGIRLFAFAAAISAASLLSNLGFRGESIGHPYSIRLPPLAPSTQDETHGEPPRMCKHSLGLALPLASCGNRIGAIGALQPSCL